MTDEKRPENFAERLQRIEKTRQGQPAVTAEDLGIKPEPSPYEVPQENHTLRNGLIWIGIVIAAIGAGAVGYQSLPEDLKAMIAGTEVAEDEVAAETVEVPAEPEVLMIAETDMMSNFGATLQSPRVANLTSQTINLRDIATNIALPTADTIMGDIIPFDRNVSCNLRTPLATEKLMNVRLENGLLPAPVQAFSNVALADQLLRNVKAVTQGMPQAASDGQIKGKMQTVDVFVTDNSAPIYLVLQNLHGGVLWNIHTAPDVSIAHIAMISQNEAGLVNPPASATFDGLLISDFLEPYQIGDDETKRECMIRPWREPQSEWVASQNIAATGAEDSNLLQPYEQGHAAYNSWFTETFNVDAGTNAVAPRDAAHVLVGPRPAAPLGYQDLAGQNIHIMRTDNIVVGDRTARGQAVDALHHDTLVAAVGGDVALLNPSVVERAKQ